MCTIHSYLKQDGEFVPVAAVEEPPADLYYIDGAMELTVDGTALLTTAHWDLVDQLWVYFVRAVLDVERGGTETFRFPDQPLLVTVQRSGSAVEVTVGEDDPTSATTDYDAFEAVFFEAADRFFAQMEALVRPDGPEPADEYQAQLADAYRRQRERFESR